MEQVSETSTEQTLSGEIVPQNMDTINATLADTGTVTIAEVTAPVMPQIDALPDQTPKQMMQRLYPLGTIPWGVADATMSSSPLLSIQPFKLLIAADLNVANVAYFQYMRSDMEIHFRFNTTQFYAGALMITAVPHVLPSQVYPYTNSAYARSWNKPHVLSAQQQDTLVIQLPWLEPERFFSVDALTAGVAVCPWTVFIDVLAPLVVSTANACDNCAVIIQGRFVNPQLIWPVDPTDPSRVRLQSSAGTTPTIRKARGGMTLVSKNNSSSDPVASAVSTIGSVSSSMLPSTVTSSIDSSIGSISQVINTVQPLVDLLGSFGLFDKPNDPSAPERVVNQPGITFCQSDIRDTSMPLSLYKTSYLGRAPLPDGLDWTFHDIAMRPCVDTVATITDDTPSFTVDLPGMHTPVGYCIAQHEYSHTSFMVYLQFFAATFNSARILFTYVPYGVTVTGSIQDQLTHTIDVKGDTEASFTLPYIYPTDFIPNSNIMGSLDIALYPGTNIMGSDCTVTNKISCAVWIAAAPDCQFALPQLPLEYIIKGAPPEFPKRKTSRGKPQPRFRRSPQLQCSITEKFNRVFPPFVANCTFYTDNHYCMSEVSGRVVDLLKRYQEVENSAIVSGPLYPQNYIPASSTIGYFLSRCFLFWRGGVMYKFIGTTLNTGFSHFALWTNPGTLGIAPLNACGSPFIQQPLNPQDDFSVTMPYISVVPYQLMLPEGEYDIFYDDHLFVTFTNRDTPPITPLNYPYTAVRDDYQVGWLIAPPEYEAGVYLAKNKHLYKLRSLKQLVVAPHRRDARRGPAPRRQAARTPAKNFDFTVL